MVIWLGVGVCLGSGIEALGLSLDTMAGQYGVGGLVQDTQDVAAFGLDV